MGGLGRAGNAHGINEFVTLDGMRRFADSLCLWLHACARTLGTPQDSTSARSQL